MKFLAASHHFQKQLKKLPHHKREKVIQVLKAFLKHLGEGDMPAGYGFKKINGDKYEIRVDINTRIAMKADGDTLVCHVIGNHEHMKRYLKAYRTK